MIKGPRRLLVIFFFIFLLGCNSYSETFIKEGIITEINKERSFIYVDHSPIKVTDTDNFEIGQKVKITLKDKTSDDDWDPKDFTVKKIEYID